MVWVRVTVPPKRTQPLRAHRDVFNLKNSLREECILRKVNMMVPKKSLILAGAALALFGATSSAQSQSGKVFARYNKPLKSATLDLATGTITRGPAVNNRLCTTVVDFGNNDLGGFVGVDTGAGFCEWFDSGVKGTCSVKKSDSANNCSKDISRTPYCATNAASGNGS